MVQFNDLTDEQKHNYGKTLRKFGIDRGSVPKQVTIDGSTTNVQLNVTTVTVRDLQHLKELVGVPDTRYTKEKHSDSFITYPEAMKADRARLLLKAKDADSLHATLEPEERQAIDDASRAYVLGDSRKVPKELVELSNTVNFPLELQVKAADDLRITGKYVISAPPTTQKLVHGTITIVKPDGQIVAEGVDLSIDAQHIVVE